MKRIVIIIFLFFFIAPFSGYSEGAETAVKNSIEKVGKRKRKIRKWRKGKKFNTKYKKVKHTYGENDGEKPKLPVR